MKITKFFYRVLLPALIFINILSAHPLNTTNIDLDLNNQPTLSLRFYIFNLATPLMLNSDPTSEIVYSKKDEILEYIQNSISVKNGSKQCKLRPFGFGVENDITLRSEFFIDCKKEIKKLSIHFTLFFEFDKTQVGVMQVINGKDEQLFIFNSEQKNYSLTLSRPPKKSVISDLFNFIKEGVWHIWEGIDHILFLLMLLVPSVLINRGFKRTLLDVLKIVTAFTLSHSLTLSLSMFNIINPPQQIIETLIALSVLFTAINNIYPMLPYKKEWLLAFGFGFIHGFGFANAMHEMNLQSANFFSAVFGFNLGVELGQIVIVLIILPLIYMLSFRKIYATVIVPLLSFLVANVSLLWAIDRAFNLHFMPF